jgi:class 3 adenylate cyclase
MDAAIPSSMMVLLFTDVVGSVEMKSRLGPEQYARLLGRHDKLFKSIIRSTRNAKLLKDLGDGFLASFATPADAVNAALRFQYGLTTDDWGGQTLAVRMGVHLGQVMELAQEESDETKLVGMAADMAARVMGLALPGQILLTQAAFDNARQFVRRHPLITDSPEAASGPPAESAAVASAAGASAAGRPPAPTASGHDPWSLRLEWKAHGRYCFKGSEDAIEVFEVGPVGRAPLRAPPDGDKAARAVNVDEEQMLGWRPAAGLEVPRRPGWIVEKKLGEGGFGEVWLGKHLRTRGKRVFKFCLDAKRLSSLKRELTLFRIMQDALGDRPDIAKLYEVQLEQQPYPAPSRGRARTVGPGPHGLRAAGIAAAREPDRPVANARGRVCAGRTALHRRGG